MVRNFLASLLALAGAAIAVWSPFQPWYDGRNGTGVRVDDLFTGVGVTTRHAAPLGSLFLPMGFAALLTLLGVLMGSRLVVAAAGVLVIGVTVLWMVRQAQFSGTLAAGGTGLDTGVGSAMGAGLLLFLAASLLPGRRPRRYAEPPQFDEPPRFYEPPMPDEPAALDEPLDDPTLRNDVVQPPPPYSPGPPPPENLGSYGKP
jgi:hypothetical protein